MDLRGAYVVLELAPGATEEAVRDARKMLAKVWHPDRHAGDPALQKRAEQKLADVNSAYELVRAAGFPSTLPDEPPPKSAAVAPAPPRISEPPAEKSSLEIVPRRRVRWSVVIVLAAALAGGAYLAVVRLGRSSSPPAEHVAVTGPAIDAGAAIVIAPAAPTVDAELAATEPADAATAAIDAAHATTTATFGLGATRDEVLAAQGQPTSRATVVDEEWSFGFSLVTFSKRGRVVGWWDRDDVLNVKLVPSDAAVASRAKGKGTYGVGATKDEVIAVQGTPKRISTVVDETWYYGTSSNVSFNGTGKLMGYHNVNRELSIDEKLDLQQKLNFDDDH